jgi:dihydroneopterin aldolase/2-amino-4-hydroxy-6-hydroxymethyldihydropteridine diphosphokinase
MFKIYIKDLKLYGYHGVNPEEKSSGQDFLFNIKIKFAEDALVLGKSFKDSIEETVNYSEIISLVKKINSKKKYDLLEALAGDIAREILSFSPLILKTCVKVEKINPPINEDIGSVGVKCSLENKVSSGYTRFYLSIGSNTGDRQENLRNAVEALRQNKNLEVLKVSSIYETEPMYVKQQEPFYNIALEGIAESGYGPFEMLGFLKSIEYSLGRKTGGPRFGPRIIDLDLLCFGQQKIISDILVLPHPKINERNFVLVPLAEIAPGIIIEGKEIGQYLRSCNFKESVKKISDWQD